MVRQHPHGFDALLLGRGEWVFIDMSIKDELFIPNWEEVKMKVEVSCFVGGMVVKEIVHVDKFEDADQVAKARNPFCRVVNRKVLMK